MPSLQKNFLNATLVTALAAATTLTAVPAVAAPAHAHGHARLDVAIDGAALVVSLESPLDNLLGFEHAPRNDKQRAAVKKMEDGLQSPDLFKPTPEAGCQLKEVSVEHPFKGPTTAQNSAHGDADVRWTFQCAAPTALRNLDVQLFARFPGLKSLKVQLAGPRGQTSDQLRPGKTLLAW